VGRPGYGDDGERRGVTRARSASAQAEKIAKDPQALPEVPATALAVWELDVVSLSVENLTMATKKTKNEPDLFDAVETASDGSAYQPLPSVWEGSDAELLDKMLRFYPRKLPERILDATVNRGRIWTGLAWKVVGLDIEADCRPTVIGDNCRMPFRDRAFDVVVYDPPHIPNQGKDRQKDFNTRFGLVIKSPATNGYNFTHLYPPFVREAFRVLKPEGILFCKIADYVHGHRYQWAHAEFLKAATAAGFTACDCIIKVRKGPIVDPRWKTAHHARRQHCYWLVFRKSKKCE
jgi:SAM-dependent methyltransferase